MTRSPCNHYAIATFSPGLMTNKTVFLFKNGRVWSDQDKKDCIKSFLGLQSLIVDAIQLGVSWDECENLRHDDPYVDVTSFRKKTRL